MTKTTAIVYDSFYLQHKTPPGHPEQPSRLKKIMDLLEDKNLLPFLEILKPRKALPEEISLVHSPDHIKRVEKISSSGGGYLDADTYVSAKSYESALLAAGGVITAVEKVFQTPLRTVFCLVRPPGHHATSTQGMGFCLFDNLAVGATYARKTFPISRILILDWDAHHGNGLQEIFYKQADTLYISFHQWPLYPGTGHYNEVGEGEGEGHTLNLPFPPGTGDQTYLEAISEIVEPVAYQFQPELIMVAAGFDGHWKDPLASLYLTEKGYSQIAEKLKKLALEFCEGRIIFSLEGGYHLEALSLSVLKILAFLADTDVKVETFLGTPPDPTNQGTGVEILKRVKTAHKNYWKL